MIKKKRNNAANMPQINPGTQHGGYRHALYKPDSRINNSKKLSYHVTAFSSYFDIRD